MILSAAVDERLAEVPVEDRRLDLDIGARAFAAGLGELLGDLKALPAERRPQALHGLLPFLQAGSGLVGEAEDTPGYRPVAALLFGVIVGLLDDMRPPEPAAVRTAPRLPRPLRSEAANG